MRYRLYREHKYVSFSMNELERLVAKTNFANDEEISIVKKQLEELADMLKFHAMWENDVIHELLRKKKSKLHLEIEKDHKHHEEMLEGLFDILNLALEEKSIDIKIELGYEFYLIYRLFVANNLFHIHQEETEIMEELQRLYPNDEDLKVDYDTYDKMTADEMINMIEVLFPHMDINDHFAFLDDIKTSQAEKFAVVWKVIDYLFTKENRIELAKRLGV